VRLDSIRRLLQRHTAYVEDPMELRMGSPQYGRLVLDGRPMVELGGVEAQSLLWSGDRRLLAFQSFVSGDDEPVTRVVVVDAGTRALVGASPAHRGLCDPVRFEDAELVYSHWHYRDGTRERALQLER
jgi:hypothetical protein